MAYDSGGKSKSKCNMLEGMKKHEPSSSDKSTMLKLEPSVAVGAVRSETAPTPPTLGPRTA